MNRTEITDHKLADLVQFIDKYAELLHRGGKKTYEECQSQSVAFYTKLINNTLARQGKAVRLAKLNIKRTYH